MYLEAEEADVASDWLNEDAESDEAGAGAMAVNEQLSRTVQAHRQLRLESWSVLRGREGEKERY